jgi:hypothetical protein
MDSKEIIKLMQACQKYGVASFTKGDLSVNFIVESIPNNPVSSSVYNPALTQQFPDRQIEPTPEVENEVLEELRMSQLMLDDPEAYEQMIVDSHMERGRTLFDD